MKVLTLAAGLLVILLCITVQGNAFAQPQCSGEALISHRFDNGAKWEFCWESRIRENLVLSEIYYSPPGKPAFPVLGSARLSQLHVAYDDNDVTYYDVTQYGLGGDYLQTLTEADCPSGRLLYSQSRAAACLREDTKDAGYRTPTRAAQAQSLNLYSVSQVGAYAYIASYTFFDDGAFEPGIGATGALQRKSTRTDEPYGRTLGGDPDTLWLSHTHNYYWRLDFDLGESATDDTVSELKYQINSEGLREMQRTVFATEQARRTDPDAHLVWRISENSDPQAIAYQIEPVRNGHRYVRKAIEPYSDFDFFVTVVKDCERFASQNQRFNPQCSNNVLEFVDGESLQNQDLVLWNRISFHHVPRNEDRRHMHTHWDSMRIRPVNLHPTTTNLASILNQAPVLLSVSDRNNQPGDKIHETLQADDVDADVLSFTATGLPPEITIDITGHMHGELATAGIYTVTVSVQDDHTNVSETFVWTVGNDETEVPANDGPIADSGASKSSGATSPVHLLLLALALFIRRTVRSARNR
ncbi:MAG: putative Ig domain-containing protein [Granulosicoccus sp.]